MAGLPSASDPLAWGTKYNEFLQVEHDSDGTHGNITTKNVYPSTDDTYYLGKNDDDAPFAYKGVILKDTTNGKYYRIEVISGSITATDLTD